MSNTTFLVDRQGRLVEANDRPPLFEQPPAPTHRFDVIFDDGRVVQVDGADAYQPEGHLITFFASRSARKEIDAWSTRVASYRAATVVSVERVADEPAAERSTGEPIPGADPMTGFEQDPAELSARHLVAV